MCVSECVGPGDRVCERARAWEFILFDRPRHWAVFPSSRCFYHDEKRGRFSRLSWPCSVLASSASQAKQEQSRIAERKMWYLCAKFTHSFFFFLRLLPLALSVVNSSGIAICRNINTGHRQKKSRWEDRKWSFCRHIHRLSIGLLMPRACSGRTKGKSERWECVEWEAATAARGAIIEEIILTRMCFTAKTFSTMFTVQWMPKPIKWQYAWDFHLAHFLSLCLYPVYLLFESKRCAARVRVSFAPVGARGFRSHSNKFMPRDANEPKTEAICMRYQSFGTQWTPTLSFSPSLHHCSLRSPLLSGFRAVTMDVPSKWTNNCCHHGQNIRIYELMEPIPIHYGYQLLKNISTHNLITRFPFDISISHLMPFTLTFMAQIIIIYLRTIDSLGIWPNRLCADGIKQSVFSLNILFETLWNRFALLPRSCGATKSFIINAFRKATITKGAQWQRQRKSRCLL